MVYVASDLKIKESDERDQDIIRGWNSVITDEDWVLLTGIITPSKEAASVKRIFDTLKGEKRIMDISFKNSDEVERLKFITGNQPYQISGFVPGVIQGKKLMQYCQLMLISLNGKRIEKITVPAQGLY